MANWPSPLIYCEAVPAPVTPIVPLLTSGLLDTLNADGILSPTDVSPVFASDQVAVIVPPSCWLRVSVLTLVPVTAALIIELSYAISQLDELSVI